MLTEKEKKDLLKLVRNTLQSYLATQEVPALCDLTGALLKPAGAFVTLKAVRRAHGLGGGRDADPDDRNELRGCIGCFDTSDSLAKTVQRMAVAAATEDPRFYPVQLSELPLISIEISVLSPREPLKDLKSVEVGRHGLCVAKDFRRGVLLPQVPVEHGWSREEFLSHTCMKAGLPADAWEKGGLKWESFTAQIIGEKGDACH